MAESRKRYAEGKGQDVHTYTRTTLYNFIRMKDAGWGNLIEEKRRWAMLRGQLGVWVFQGAMETFRSEQCWSSRRLSVIKATEL